MAIDSRALLLTGQDGVWTGTAMAGPFLDRLTPLTTQDGGCHIWMFRLRFVQREEVTGSVQMDQVPPPHHHHLQ